jgi:hypothetical protein
LAITVVSAYLLSALLFIAASRTSPSAGEAFAAAGKANGSGRTENSPLLSTGGNDEGNDGAA